MIHPNIKPAYNVAIILSAKQPFIDWINILSEERMFSLESVEPNVYLLPESVSVDQAEEVLKTIYLDLLRTELIAWTEEEVLQPRDKTYKLFCEWFDAKICTTVLNVLDIPTKE